MHGVLLSLHDMYYTDFQDSFNGFVLYDAENRPILIKTYETDRETGEFTLLLTEEWNMQSPLPFLKRQTS